MRIISGKHKGRRITAPKNLIVRPTTDQAKEGLFNILWNRFNFTELSVLDLFSGIGSISLEFSSRGATDITAVDKQLGCLKFINKTSSELDAEINTIKSDVFQFLDKANLQYDLIFVDPPYNFTDDQFENIIQSVFKNGLLSEQGLLIVEHSKHTDLSSNSNFSEIRRYGGTSFSFFQIEE